ncbi:H-NS family nucleoid-associated regulatory protein [Yoonia vestfoldensis]|jgi:DNA-binding protein H-NS|uniref:Trans-acting regulatory protein HvrA n=1 Tax=Yoonia vestfoldensis TaxID=245188 RepID=A0A1Y0E9W1_9RHOB|nr:H-NS histone family protein [Yoonia vestfoldensis]ARU00190.1 trans-acting regulatory protein HvrA [Yoonia vestfoldensis]
MFKENLDSMSVNELKQLHKDITKAISTFEDRQKAEARSKVEALAKELGFSLSELIGTNTKSRRIAAAPKYQHPENPTLTWSGRGRKPLWYIEALASGKTPEDLAIAQPAN